MRRSAAIMRRMSLLAALFCMQCLLPASEARPQRSSGPGPGQRPIQLSGAAANSMAPLTSEWRDESIRRLSGPEDVSLSQSPFAWKPLLSDGRRRTSRYFSTQTINSTSAEWLPEIPTTPSTMNSALTTGQRPLSGPSAVTVTLTSTVTTTPTLTSTTGRRLLIVDDDPTKQGQEVGIDDSWVLVAVGQKHSTITPGAIFFDEPTLQGPAHDLNASVREFPGHVQSIATDNAVLSSIHKISSTLLRPEPQHSSSVSDKTFLDSDETTLSTAGDMTLVGRRINQPHSSGGELPNDNTWLPVVLASPKKSHPTEAKPGSIQSLSPQNVSDLSPELKKHPAMQHLQSLLLQQRVNHTSGGLYVYRPIKSPIITSSTPDYRPSTHFVSSSLPPNQAHHHQSIHTKDPSLYTFSATTTTKPSHFTFSAVLSSSPEHNGTPKPNHSHQAQHYHEKPSQSVVSVIKRPVNTQHNTWGVGAPKPQQTVLNNYNDPAWYAKPPVAPPPNPQIIIIEDKLPDYVTSTTQAPPGNPESDVKCPSVFVSASQLVENHNQASKEGCANLNIVIQSAVANTHAAPVPGAVPPFAPPTTPVSASKPVVPHTVRPKPTPTQIIQADPGGNSSSSSSSSSTTTSSTSFWSNLLNGTTRFGVSFWSGVFLAPVLVLMAVGTLLTPWVVPYLLTRGTRALGPTTRFEDAERRIRAGVARCITPPARYTHRWDGDEGT